MGCDVRNEQCHPYFLPSDKRCAYLLILTLRHLSSSEKKKENFDHKFASSNRRRSLLIGARHVLPLRYVFFPVFTTSFPAALSTVPVPWRHWPPTFPISCCWSSFRSVLPLPLSSFTCVLHRGHRSPFLLLFLAISSPFSFTAIWRQWSSTSSI